MKRLKVLCAIVALCLALPGCTPIRQVENQAYAIVLGVDMEQGVCEITVLIPKIGGSSASAQGDQSTMASGYTVASARGPNYAEALENLKIALTRRLNLTQIKMVVVSENMARQDDFLDVMTALAQTYQLYTAANFVVCEGNAKEFVSTQQPVIGTRISRALTARFESYEELGYIPSSTFADVWYDSLSVYSDPMATYASLASPDQENSKPQNDSSEAGKSGANSAVSVSGEIAQLPVESENTSFFYGSALFENGKMVGSLSGRQMQWISLIRGNLYAMNVSQGHHSVQLRRKSPTRIQVDLSQNPIVISLDVSLSVANNAQYSDLQAIYDFISDGIMDVINKCQSVACDPFGFANEAAMKFLTMEQWLAFPWREAYKHANIQLNLELARINA